MYEKLFFAFHRNWTKAEVCFGWHCDNCFPWGFQSTDGKLAFLDFCFLWSPCFFPLIALFMPAACLAATLPASLGLPLSPFTYSCLPDLLDKVSSYFSLVSCSCWKIGRGVVLRRIGFCRRWSPCFDRDPSAWGILFS